VCTTTRTSSRTISWRCSSVSPASRRARSSASASNGRLGHVRGSRGLEGRHAGFQLGPLGDDPIELRVELCILEATPDTEGQGLLALTLERVERPPEGDGLGGGDGTLGIVFDAPVEIREKPGRPRDSSPCGGLLIVRYPP